ncbi:MAG: ribosome recycling factor [Rhodothermales bacterium]
MVDEMIKMVLDDAEDKMNRAMEHLRHELSSIRAGRATPAMLEHIRVTYYGANTPLNQMANVSAPQPDLLVVQPWDRSALNDIEKAIIAANIGVMPSNDGVIIRVPVPPLSEERRRDLAKTARTRGEDARVAVRNIRRHVKDEIKSLQQDENLPEDMRYEAEEKLQGMTDRHIESIDKLLQRKEEEIMEV